MSAGLVVSLSELGFASGAVMGGREDDTSSFVWLNVSFFGLDWLCCIC